MAMRPVAFVTGGAQRLGKVIVEHLAGRGYDVVLHYNTSADAAASIAAECTARHGGKVIPVQADLRLESDILALFGRAVDAVDGREIALLINNASLFEPDTIMNATLETWDRHFKTNVQAPFFLTQAFARQWVPEGSLLASSSTSFPMADSRDDTGETIARGLVINMIDQRVRKLTPMFSTYTLAKSSLWTLTQTCAQALAPVVRVNAIGPGPTLCGARQAPEHFADQRRALPLERGPNPTDILAALDYFIRAPAVTGQLLCVDGGQHLAWQTVDAVIPE
jgi:NAD(P)-dependent dehydrogenase (short-subunit alcohol dehydrogenase family)